MRRAWMLVPLALLAFTGQAQAAQCLFGPSFSTTWESGGNCGRAPNMFDTVIVQEGAAVTVSATPLTANQTGFLFLDGGTLSFAPGAALSISSAGSEDGNLIIAKGTFTGAGQTTVDGGASIQGDFTNTDGHTLALSGPSSWTGPTRQIKYGSTAASSAIVNNGSFAMTGAALSFTSLGQAGDLTFTNNGTIVRNAGANPTAVAQLRNLRSSSLTSSIQVTGATLALTGSAAGNQVVNDITASSNAAVEVAGSYAFTGESTISGGTFRQLNGASTLAAGAAFTPVALRLSGGTLTLDRPATVDSFGMSGGTRSGTGTLTAGETDITGGTLTGDATTAAGDTQITATFRCTDGHTLIVSGVSEWTAGTLQYGTTSDSSTLVSQGQFTIQALTDSPPGFEDLGQPGELTMIATGPLIVYGPIEIPNLQMPETSAQLVVVGQPVELTGSRPGNDIAGIVTLGGTLDISGDYEFLSTSQVSGNTLRQSGGSSSFASGGLFIPMTLTLADGTLALNRTGAVDQLNLNGGTRAGSGTLTADNATLSSGALAGVGTTNTSGATIAGSFQNTDGHTLALAGVTTWTGGQIQYGTTVAPSTVSNSGELTLTGVNTSMGSMGLTGDIAVVNSGTIGRNGTGSAMLRNVTSSGAVEVDAGTLTVANALTQTAGTTHVASGTTLAGGVKLQGGTLKGSGTIAGLVEQTNGKLAPGASVGTLTINGSLSQTGGTTEIEIGPDMATFDRISVVGNPGTAALGGTLEPVHLGTFTPAVGDTFQFLTAAVPPTGSYVIADDVLPPGKAYALVTPQSSPFGAALVTTTTPSAPTSVVPPSVSGEPAVGQPLSCNPGSFAGNPEPAVTIEWLRGGSPIAGAGSATYVVSGTDAGKELRCRVTAANPSGQASATSPGVSVPAASSPSPEELRLSEASTGSVATAFGLPSAKKCVRRRNLRLRIEAPDGVTIATVAVRANRKKVKVREVSTGYVARIDLRRTRKKSVKVTITVVTRTNLKLRGARVYRKC